MFGKVIRKISNFFEVKIENKVITCHASKKLIDKNKKILVGDNVEINFEKKYILKILKRKNELSRPSVSNIDISFILNSIIEPKINFMLLDKFILISEYKNIKPIIIITKLDIVSNDEIKKIKEKLKYYEKIGYKIIYKEKN